MNVATAWTVGRHFGISDEACQRALSNYVPSNHRSQVVRTERNWVLLDAYNANPSSVAHALASFAANGHTHPLVVLGDMAELGEASDQAHLDTVKDALERGLEVWTVGQAFGRVPVKAARPERTSTTSTRWSPMCNRTRLRGAKFWSKGAAAPSLKS